MQKTNAKITVVFLCLFMAVVILADVTRRDRPYSESENRILDQQPDWDAQAFMGDKGPQTYEEYLKDQFPGRETWVGLRNLSHFYLEENEKNGFYLAEDGYLIRKYSPYEISSEKRALRLQQLKELTEAYPGMKIMQVPTADVILRSKLSVFAPSYPEKAFCEELASLVGEEKVIDLFTYFKEHRKEDLYYHTDPRWTSLGAYYGYQAYIDRMGLTNAGFDPDQLASVSGLMWGPNSDGLKQYGVPDQYKVFLSTVTKPGCIVHEQGERTRGYYDSEKLKGRVPYNYYPCAGEGFCKVLTGYYKEGKELFLIKDSYGNALLPLLTPHYQTIYVLDTDHFSGSLQEIMEQYVKPGKTDVLMVTGIMNFLEHYDLK